MRQLKSRSEEVASAVLANAATRVVFRVGEQDAKALADGFSFFEPNDLQSLDVGQAIARIERADFDFNLQTQRLEPEDSERAVARRSAIVIASRTAYATPAAEVDAVLSSSRQDAPSPVEVLPKAKVPGRRARASEAGDAGETSSLPGRGGAQHKYLQSLVRRLAEDRGFEVSLEKTVLDGHGHEGHGVTVACEISVTTKIEHEVGNLTKCLSADFDYAVLISSDGRTLDLARAEMSGADQRRVRIISPGAVGAFLDELVGAVSSKIANAGGRPKPAMAATADSDEGYLLTTTQAGQYVGLAVQTLATMRTTGDSPPFIKFGRRVMYDRKDLDAWILARRRRSTSDKGAPTPAPRSKRA
jgi:Helix-turn-helix domain